MRMKILLALVTLCQLVWASPRIINGQSAEKSDVGYWMTVRLLVNQEGIWLPLCTGSVLAPDLILTAAHCLEQANLKDLRIGYEVQPFSFASQLQYNSPVDVLEKFKTSVILEAFVHPDYHFMNADHDMVVLKIDGKIPTDFQVISLLPERLFKNLDQTAKFAVELYGYGYVSDDPITESAVLRKATVPAVFEGFHLITDQSASGGCSGDSGGPAFLTIEGKMYLVGVAFGPTKDSHDCRTKGLWGNAALEIQFLNQAAQKLGSAARF
jgi:secreted trypsin-like serine protease